MNAGRDAIPSPLDALWSAEEFAEALDGLGPLALRAFVTLGLPETMSRGPQSVCDLARVCTADTETLALLLDYLAVRGVVEARDGRYGLSPLSFRLLPRHPEGTAPWLDETGPGALLDAALRDVTASVRSGVDWFQREHGRSFYDVMATAGFAERRGEHGSRLAEAFVSSGLVEGVGNLVDVGGGDGSFLMTVLAAMPTSATGVVLDLPSTVVGRQAAVEAAGLAERLAVVGGDFFSEVPPCTGILVLSNVLHNWPDRQARQILSTCAAALAPGAQLIILEGLTDLIPPRAATAMDLRMKLLCGGRERDGAAFDALGQVAGLRRVLTRELTSEHFALVYEGAPDTGGTGPDQRSATDTATNQATIATTTVTSK